MILKYYFRHTPARSSTAAGDRGLALVDWIWKNHHTQGSRIIARRQTKISPCVSEKILGCLKGVSLIMYGGWFFIQSKVNATMIVKKFIHAEFFHSAFCILVFYFI